MNRGTSETDVCEKRQKNNCRIRKDFNTKRHKHNRKMRIDSRYRRYLQTIAKSKPKIKASQEKQ